MLFKARMFLVEQGVMEVDCPILTSGASVDAHIDLIPAVYHRKCTRYMHSSPEYGMKRLLSEGIGDIFQISHVFRDGESGSKHNPEFTMAEWYRVGIPFSQMIDETVDFIRLFLGPLPHTTITYRDALKKYAGFDYVNMEASDLVEFMKLRQIDFYPDAVEEGKDALLNIILGALVEPNLGQDELCALAYYPASQAALAKTALQEGALVAERFEVYYQGVELANGYHELTDSKEQRKRFIEANQHRLHLGKTELPIDEFFLAALEKGLPDCCGVAVGFDRLMMLRHKRKVLSDVMPFVWDTA